MAAVARVSLVGVLGHGLFVGAGQPALDVEGDDVEVVFLLFGQCHGFSHAFEEGQTWAFGRVHTDWRMSI